jgi:hypothetical protein
MKKLLIVLLLAGGVGYAADEVRPDVTIKDVETSEVFTTTYTGATGDDTIQVRGMRLYSTSDRKWFRIAAAYETRPEWIDRLTVEYYVLMPSPDKKEVLFKGVVNYVDIPEGRDHKSEMYMHFNSYARHYDRGNIEYAVVVLIDGQEVAVKTSREEPAGWWKSMTPHPCGLLNRLDTPFRVINVEEYEAQDLCAWPQ